jgi:hypothetical protein
MALPCQLYVCITTEHEMALNTAAGLHNVRTKGKEVPDQTVPQHWGSATL